jgi:hypothetical protein
MLIHNRTYKTILEKSLDFLGVEGYSVVRPYLPRGHWRNTYKIPAALGFVRECHKEFILHIDSDDAILMGNPQRAVDYLEESGGEMLLSTTDYTRYDFMPDREHWFDGKARDAGWTHSRNVHLNAGVYVARRAHLLQFLEAAAEYVTEDEPEWQEYEQRDRPTAKSTFPMGCGSEQNIFRFLYPSFAPAMRLDYAAKLAFR